MAMLVLNVRSVFVFTEVAGEEGDKNVEIFGAIGLASDVALDKVRIVFSLANVRIVRFEVIEHRLIQELVLLEEYRKCHVPPEDTQTHLAIIEVQQLYNRALHLLSSQASLDKIVKVFQDNDLLMEVATAANDKDD